MFEHLESRRLFAGSPVPTAGVVGSTLVVTGGTKTDNVQVFEDGFGQVHVQYNDSSGNHEILSTPAAGLTFATVDTAGKDDKINVDLDTVSYAVNAGGGNDQIVLNGDASGSANGQAGNDAITATTTNNPVNITGGDGADNITITDNAGGSAVSGDKGKDTISVYEANNTVVQGGADDDKIFINSSGAAAGFLAADIDAGAGNDLIVIQAGDNHLDGNVGTDTLQLLGGSTSFGEISIEKHI